MSDLTELQEKLEEPEFSEAPGRITKQQTTYLVITVRSIDREFVYRIDYINKRRFRIESDWLDQIEITEKHPVNLSERKPNFAAYIGKRALPTALVRSAALKASIGAFDEWLPPSEFINSFILKTSNEKLTDCLVLSGPETFIKLFKRELGNLASHLNILPIKGQSNSPGKILLFGTSFVWADDFKVTKVA